MRRRDFIKAIAGSAVGWPLAARAQQAAMPVIGFLGVTDPSSLPERLVSFRRGLNEEGFIEGKNLSIEYRWAGGHYDRFAELAADLVHHQVAVIAAPGPPAIAIAAKSATTTVPIVFAVAQDPVTLGLVVSLSRPGGNATGINMFTAELTAKRLGLLRELLPSATRVAALINPGDPGETQLAEKELETSARAMGLQSYVVKAVTSQGIDDAFAAFGRERPDAIFVASDAFFARRRVQLAILAAKYGIPATYSSRDYPEVGGLMSYGTNLNEGYRQAGIYTGQILKGAKASALPVLQLSTFELVINLQTAKSLGINVPPTLLARTDEVIE